MNKGFDRERCCAVKFQRLMDDQRLFDIDSKVRVIHEPKLLVKSHGSGNEDDGNGKLQDHKSAPELVGAAINRAGRNGFKRMKGLVRGKKKRGINACKNSARQKDGRQHLQEITG